MVDEELKANKQLTDYTVHDLNKDPAFPYPDNTFDVVTNCVRCGDGRTRGVAVMPGRRQQPATRSVSTAPPAHTHPPPLPSAAWTT